MKIIINIPRSFERHFNNDKFEDSFERLKADAECMAGRYEKELCDMLIKAFAEAEQYTEVAAMTDDKLKQFLEELNSEYVPPVDAGDSDDVERGDEE